uniref:ATPase n=1 Tax=Panagrellus redivivus TaxID=6233 RepID=A0A7E4V784_PANRE
MELASLSLTDETVFSVSSDVLVEAPSVRTAVVASEPELTFAVSLLGSLTPVVADSSLETVVASEAYVDA